MVGDLAEMYQFLAPRRLWWALTFWVLLLATVLCVAGWSDLKHSFFRPPPTPGLVPRYCGIQLIPNPEGELGNYLFLGVVTDDPEWFAVRFYGSTFWEEAICPMPREKAKGGKHRRLLYELQRRPNALGDSRSGMIEFLWHRKFLFIHFPDASVFLSSLNGIKAT